MKLESNIKQEQIVEAALRRFAHFGVAKTTITEVADDLSLSKQSLAYYFPDKQHLVKAVVEKIGQDYFTTLEAEMNAALTVKSALLKLVEVKSLFFEKYFMLAQTDHSELPANHSPDRSVSSLTEKESALVTSLLEKGIRSGELKPVVEAQKTSRLFLETLYAFSRCVKDRGALPDKESFQQVLLKQKEVITLFYQGLKKEGTWQN